jgi:hypothetical protein
VEKLVTQKNFNNNFDYSFKAYLSFLLNSYPSLFCLFFIFLGLTLNTFYNSISSHFGFVWPYSSFMYHPADRFADFFKYILSFPNNNDFKIYNNILIPKEQLLRYLNIEFYNAGEFPDPNNNRQPVYFNPPFATLIALLINKLFTLFDVVGLFVFLFITCYGLCLFLLNKIYGKFCYFLTLSFLFSYPVIFGFTRGHPFSLINLVLLLGCFYFILINKRAWLSILLLAICINIRPNLLIFILMFFPLGFKNLLKYSLSTVLLSVVILLISYFLVQYLFPMYNFERFLYSLDWYRNLLVIPGVGHYSSSFLGLLYNFGFTHSVVLEYVIYSLGLFFLILSLTGFLLKIITIDIYLISIFLVYQIVSLNLENYYLLNFWIPLVFLITYLKNSERTDFNLRKFCIIILLIILVPKEYPNLDINLSQTINPLCGFLCLTVITYKIIYNFFSKEFNLKKVIFNYVKS